LTEASDIQPKNGPDSRPATKRGRFVSPIWLGVRSYGGEDKRIDMKVDMPARNKKTVVFKKQL
jgi:hypothetical protein